MDRLRQVLESQGKSLVGALHRHDRWLIYAHDPKRAGRKPKPSECRDSADYKLLMDAWEKAGTFVLFVDEDYDKAVQGALEVAQK